MILQNLTKAIREQNYYAVVLEFLIVIAGVVIGFQIQGWNEVRNQRSDILLAEKNLHVEAAAALAELKMTEAFYVETLFEHRDELIRVLSSDLALQSSSIEDLGIMNRMSFLPERNMPRSVYDELVANGLYAQVGDQGLRASLREYYLALEFYMQVTDRLRDQLYTDWDHEGVRVIFDEDARIGTRIVYDLGMLQSDPDFVEKSAINDRTQRFALSFMRDLIGEAEEVCAEFERYRGTSCSDISES